MLDSYMTPMPPSVSTAISTTTVNTPSTSERFQKKLNETKSFGDAITEVFTDLVTLEIVTWAAQEGEIGHKPGNRLRTVISLIDGDIENEIGSEFLPGSPYEQLREFHNEQVMKGSETITKNLEALIQVGRAVKSFFSQEKTSSNNMLVDNLENNLTQPVTSQFR